MNSRKRQAAEPLLPLRQPKQPRRALNGYNGETASPSELNGILSRYRQVGQDVLQLARDTARVGYIFLFSGSTIMPEENGPLTAFHDDVASSSSMSDSSSVSTPRQTPSPEVKVFSSESDGSQGHIKSRRKHAVIRSLKHPPEPKAPSLQQILASRPNAFDVTRDDSSVASTSRRPSASSSIPDSYHLNDDTSLDTIHVQSTPRQRPKSFASIPTSSFDLSSTNISRKPTEEILTSNLLPRMDNLRLNGTRTHDSSMRSSQTSDTSTPFSFSQSQTDLSSQATSMPPPTQTTKRHPLRHRDREHIHKKVHKANVQRQKLVLKEEMMKEIYAHRRRQGFTSGYSDFKGLLDYQKQLNDLNLENAPRPHYPSSSLLVGKLPTPRPRRIFTSEDEFLQRALDKARATLDSPKPAKPFSPSLDQLQGALRLKDAAIDDIIRPPIPQALPTQDDQLVGDLLRKRGVIAKFAREQVSDGDLSRLRPGEWLNDEIINFYGAMILARSEASVAAGVDKKKKAGGRVLDVHYFSSFFWSKLTNDGYEKGRLAKWTKKIDIFTKDVILFPVNHSNAHWTAAAINFRRKRVESYDSMGVAKETVFKLLRSYLESEHQNKKKKPFNFDGWTNWAPEDTPQQENGYDCGVFTCHFLEALSRGEESFRFSQANMRYLRRRMIWEIGNGRLRGGDYA